MLTLKTGNYTYNDFVYLKNVLISGQCTKTCKPDCPNKTACQDVTRLISFLDKTIATLETNFVNEEERDNNAL